MSRVRIIKIKLVEYPEDVTDEELAEFVWQALQSWGGQFRYDDPLFDSLLLRSITINKTTFV